MPDDTAYSTRLIADFGTVLFAVDNDGTVRLGLAPGRCERAPMPSIRLTPRQAVALAEELQAASVGIDEHSE